ncbi:MAG TPA: FAD:protein FMN transferase [Stellaceae bacterium]|nr:FAD:protein FMN transferase [Stellaceae bacterium]
MSRSNSLRRARPLLGTFVEIRVQSDSPAAEAAILAAFAAIARVERLMSAHRADSELSRLNAVGHVEAVEVDPWTYDVLAAALRISGATDGLFDCTVAPALARQGFLPRRLQRAGSGHPSWRDILLLPGRRVRFRRRLALDLGGIAKGFAVDEAVARLRAAGDFAGAVNAGGDLRVFGPAAEPIHLRDPAEPRRLLRVGSLKDGAIATSASYFAARRRNGRRVAPIVDPRRRTVIAASRRSVSVIAADALTADALTKPVMLEGPGSAEFLARCGARALILEAGAPPLEIGRAA